MRKRLGYVAMIIGALTGIGFNIRDAYELSQIGFPTPIWTAIGLFLFFVGTFAVVHYKSVENKQALSTSTPGIVLRPKNKLRENDFPVLMNLNDQMLAIHGDDDLWGIQLDYLNGIDTNEILKRNCTVCGKPRNQRGKHHDK